MEICKTVSTDVNGLNTEICNGNVFGHSLHENCALRFRGTGGLCIPYSRQILPPNGDKTYIQVSVRGEHLNGWQMGGVVAFNTLYGSTDYSRLPVSTVIDKPAITMFSRTDPRDYIFPISACVANLCNYMPFNDEDFLMGDGDAENTHFALVDAKMPSIAITSFTNLVEIKKCIKLRDAWSVFISPFLSVENFASTTCCCHNIDIIPMDRMFLRISFGTRDEIDVRPTHPNAASSQQQQQQNTDTTNRTKKCLRLFYGKVNPESTELEVSVRETIYDNDEPMIDIDASYNCTLTNLTEVFLGALCYIALDGPSLTTITEVSVSTDRLPWSEEVRIVEGNLSAVQIVKGAPVPTRGLIERPFVYAIS